MELGEDSRVKASDVVARKVVFEKSFNQSIRKNCGVEIEKSAFLKKYGNDIEHIKGANFHTIRRRDFKTGRMKVEQVTSILDLDEGEVRFEDIKGICVESQQVVDSGLFDFTDDQQDRAMDDTAHMLLGAARDHRVQIVGFHSDQ